MRMVFPAFMKNEDCATQYMLFRQGEICLKKL